MLLKIVGFQYLPVKNFAMTLSFVREHNAVLDNLYKVMELERGSKPGKGHIYPPVHWNVYPGSAP